MDQKLIAAGVTLFLAGETIAGTSHEPATAPHDHVPHQEFFDPMHERTRQNVFVVSGGISALPSRPYEWLDDVHEVIRSGLPITLHVKL